MRICNKCKVEKELSEFHKDKNRKDERQYTCKVCIKEYQVDNADKIREVKKQWKIDNAEYITQWQQGYIQSPQGKLVRKASKHKRRVLLRTNTVGKNFTPADIIIKLKLQHNKCVYCNVSIKGGYHIDHIIPISKCGGNESWNIQLLCQKCNSEKSDNTAIEYAQKHGKIC